MTYDAFEISQESGHPVELYLFTAGNLTFRFTSAAADIVIDDPQPAEFQGTYAAIPIKRTRFQLSADGARKDGIEIELPSSNALAQRYISIVPGIRTNLRILRFHRFDLPTPEIITAFRGDVQTVAFTKNSRLATMQVLSLARARGRTIPRFTFQAGCNHMLYDARCKISENSALFEKFLTVASVDTTQTVLTVTGAGGFGFSDFFVQGLVEFDGDYRMVVDQGGAGDEDITVLVPFIDSPVGSQVRLLAGCKLRLAEDCRDKFANVPNYGGWPQVPKKNPFETGIP